jgi:hypothetical protein
MISKVTGKTYPSHTREAKRSARLKELGWTPELFDKVWREQGGKCAICPKVLNLDMVQNDSRACADHEHSIPIKPRGILCTTCNVMLGQAQDNPEILRTGAVYLEKFSLEIPAEATQTTTYPISHEAEAGKE